MHDAVADRVSIDVFFGEDERRAALEAETAAGLLATPKHLTPKWLYDDRGSELFEQITRLPEYYLTRRERSILAQRAPEIAELTGAETLVELGSGSSEKTRVLLDALSEAGTLQRFVPLDVSEAPLRAASEAVAFTYPELVVQGVVGDFERNLDVVPQDGRRLVVFLGSTIGNLEPHQRARFLGGVAAGLGPGDAFLVGFDLLKDVARLEAAYDDAAGVTRAFTLNVLDVLNRELRADFDRSRFEHTSRFDPEHEWMDLGVRSLATQWVRVPALELEVRFEEGEELRTEVSTKFRRERVEEELATAGLAVERWWTDADGDFAVVLARRR